MSSEAKATFQLNRSNGLVTPCQFVQSPNCNLRPAAVEIEVIVIHCISLPPQHFGGDYIEQFFTNQLEASAHPYFQQLADLKVSAHFLIKRDGQLVQFVPTHLCAWHAGVSCFQGREKVNDFSLGIELEGSEQQPFAEAQYDTLNNLLLPLVTAYPKITESHIVAHSEIAVGRKADPGPYFDWQRLLRGLPLS